MAHFHPSSSAAALIASARTNSGLSQAELARRSGIPRSVMNVYEHGKREPSSEMLQRILNAAGFRLTAESVGPPVDPHRADRILNQVLGLAEAMPYKPKPTNSYPPLARAIAAN